MSRQIIAPPSATLRTSADSQNPSSRSRTHSGQLGQIETTRSFSPQRALESVNGQVGVSVAGMSSGRDYAVLRTSRNIFPARANGFSWAAPGRPAAPSLDSRVRRSQNGGVLLRFLLIVLALLHSVPLRAADAFLPGVERIVFLGDSITHAGNYVDYFEAYLFTRFPERQFQVINAGLPSETVSGLSEEGHAGGKFPRPSLHERLDRVLAKTRPHLIFACYGMNDGIYRPFAEERFQRFRQGLLKLREKAAAANAQLIHLTPPTFDPVPIRGKTAPAGAKGFDKPFELYNETLDRYSAWLLEQRAKSWRVFDVHGPMNSELAERRAANPEFRFANDGVHCDAAGHWIITREILRGLDQPTDNFATDGRYAELLKLVRQRGRLLTEAWLSEIGHQRPGMQKGLPLDEAQAKAAELEGQIRAVVKTDFSR